MAKKNGGKGGEGFVSPEVALPEGFTQVNSNSSNKWFKFAEGATLTGELLGRFKQKKNNKDGSPRFIYQVKLTASCQVTQKIEDDTEVLDAEVGDIVNLDEKAALVGLASYCVPGKRFLVHVAVQDKADIGDGQTFWRCAAGVKELAQ